MMFGMLLVVELGISQKEESFAKEVSQHMGRRTSLKRIDRAWLHQASGLGAEPSVAVRPDWKGHPLDFALNHEPDCPSWRPLRPAFRGTSEMHLCIL